MEMIVWIPVAVSILALVASVVIGLLSVGQAKRSADSAEKTLGLAQEQLENSVRAQQDSTQPYVWADLRPRENGDGMIQFVVGNSGPTIATDVRVEFQPSLDYVVPTREVEDAHRIQALLSDRLKSVPPGRVFAWNLGVSFEYYDKNDPRPADEIVMRVTAHGPHGPIAPVEYTVSLVDLKHQALRPVGLGMVEAPLETVGKELGKISTLLTKMHEQGRSE